MPRPKDRTPLGGDLLEPALDGDRDVSPGFYWVQLAAGGDWEVMEYVDFGGHYRGWHEAGLDILRQDAGAPEVIGPRIEPPPDED